MFWVSSETSGSLLSKDGDRHLVKPIKTLKSCMQMIKISIQASEAFAEEYRRTIGPPTGLSDALCCQPDLLFQVLI